MMAALPESVKKAWDDRKGPAVLTTVDNNGMPNSIYVGCMSLYGDEAVLVADNYFDKTRKNITAGTKGSFLFITNAGKAFQIKGDVEYHTEGEIFDNMKTWNPPKHPGNAAAALKVSEVYSGAEKLA
jgi:predicted pyridoxine 5'-phosphate oxidase superfamily flavin-nucleotide-binding protein